MKKENRMVAAAAILPVLAGIFFGQDDSYKLSAVRFVLLTALIAAYNVFLIMRRAQWEHRKTTLICSFMSLFTMGLIQGVCFLRQSDNIGEGIITGLGFLLAVVMLAAFLLLLKSEKGVTENVVSVVVFAAFLVRIFYVVMTQAHLYQNDLASFSSEGYGHLGYIYFLFNDGKLPEINPMEYYELYQPPLHYAVSALFFKALQLLGCPPEMWEELLQVLLLGYSMMIVAFINKLAIRFKLSLEGRLAAVCFAGFLPYGIMMSGSLNNDMLMTLFMVLAIYFTLKWYEKPCMKTILAMAVCIGCSMMSKVSGGLIAPAMAVLMLHRAWKDRKQWTEYLKQFVCFGFVAFPLGLWHPVYCGIKWGMPFGYVPAMGPESSQFIGAYDKWTRFFDFQGAFDQLTIQGDRFSGFTDYNIPVTLIKFAAFGESNYYDSSQLTFLLGTGVFWATLALFILMLVSMAVWCFCRDGKAVYKVFTVTGAVVSLLFFTRFCWQYPYVCTMNVRYIMGAVYLGCLTIGAAFTAIQDKTASKSASGGLVCTGIMTAVPVLYAVAVFVLMAGMEVLLP